MKEDINDSLRERVLMRRERFKPNSEDIKKIIAMNDGLYTRFRMVYDDLLHMKQLVDENIRSGRLKVSGYKIFPEYFFGYDYENGIPTADHKTLIMMSDETELSFPSCSLTEDDFIPDYDKDFINDDPALSWNIEWLDLPGLEKHYIHYFMHSLFVDSDTFCPADIPFLKPEDLQWQITVQFEFFQK